MGIENFVAEVEKRLGWKLAPARDFVFTSNVDQFGWATGEDGRRHFTAFVENGRVQDEPGKPFKTALREIAKVHKGVFRLTANQHLIIADIPVEEEKTIQDLLNKYHLDKVDFSALRLSSAACVAFPTCGLAMAESERVRRRSRLVADFLLTSFFRSTSPSSSTKSRRCSRTRDLGTTLLPCASFWRRRRRSSLTFSISAGG